MVAWTRLPLPGFVPLGGTARIPGRRTICKRLTHRRVVEIVEQRSFDLLERLGGEMLDAMFEDERVRAAEVSIGKPGLLRGATATVTLRRSR